VTTHTLFCLKGPVDVDHQLFLCGVFNSFVANYLVRMRVGMHVNVSIVERLPVPRPALNSLVFDRIFRLSRLVVSTPTDLAGAAKVQAAVAHLYHLTSEEFAHVLATFPLVSSEERENAMRWFLRDQPPPNRGAGT